MFVGKPILRSIAARANPPSGAGSEQSKQHQDKNPLIGPKIYNLVFSADSRQLMARGAVGLLIWAVLPPLLSRPPGEPPLRLQPLPQPEADLEPAPEGVVA